MACAQGHGFEMTGGYLDLRVGSPVGPATERTFESFGYEWNTFDDVREEDAQFADVYFKDLDLSSLEGQLVLDAGCGKGRYTRFVAPHAGALVALDGSSAVEAAARNLSGYPNVLVVRADLRRPPIQPATLGMVMCLGVLHHLEDPRAGFDTLVSLLGDGGRILVYVYSRPGERGFRKVALEAASLLRRLTVKLPHRVLRLVSFPVAAFLFATVVQAGNVGDRLHAGMLSGLPMAAYRKKPFRSLVLDTFDRLSAPVEHRYLWSELEGWFRSAGMVVDAVREEGGWFVLAHKGPS